MDYTFKKHQLSAAEKLWLKEVLSTQLFDARVAKVKLWGAIPEDFEPRSIDPRFYFERRPTLLGIWHVDPENEIFRAIDKVIQVIRAQIIESPNTTHELQAAFIAKRTGLREPLVRQVFKRLNDLGQFWNGASQESLDGWGSITLQGDESYDEYLRYKGLEPLLERFYTTRAPNTRKENLLLSNIWYDFLSDGSQKDFAVPQPILKRNTAFVLMAMDPLKPGLQDVYETIKEVFKVFGVRAYRADEIQHQDRITDVILNEIGSCEYVIADLSLERPNVYYEIGYAHAKGKKPILVRASGTNLHFDLSVHNVPEYQNMKELRDILRKRLTAIFGRDPFAEATAK